jgi:type I restriction enzyme S subunit
MELKPGYKQTDVGVFPDEWEFVNLGSICTAVLDCHHSTPVWTRTGAVVIRNQNIRGGKLDLSEPSFTDEKHFAERTRRAVPTFGDLVITREAPMGLVCMIPEGLKCCLGQRMVLLRIDTNIAETRYLLYAIMGEAVQRSISLAGGTGSTVSNLRIPVLKQLQILVPKKSEQLTIATALSDVDALIASLDQLIAKKRDLKQAAMQQLLTGQTRLPGFKGKWEVKTLGELFDFSGGYSASRDQLSSEGHCYLHYGDIHGATKTFVDVRADYQNIPKLDIPLKRVASKSLLEDGDVVFVDASEDDKGTSRHVVVVNKEKKPFISGLHTIVAKSKTDELFHEFRRYCFQTAAIRQQFLFYAVGTKVSGISKTNIAKLTIRVPGVPEQTAIASVLSDMDTELAALEQRREKSRALKLGMMQELLTGRTRLIGGVHHE